MEQKPNFETINVEGCMTALVSGPNTRVRGIRERIRNVLGPSVNINRPRPSRPSRPSRPVRGGGRRSGRRSQ